MMTPPMTPAATPQPKQRASAVVGTAVAARATAAAAARAVSVLVICPSIFPFRGWGGDRPIPTADSQRVPSYGLLEPTGRNPGNLSEICYLAPARAHIALHKRKCRTVS